MSEPDTEPSSPLARHTSTPAELQERLAAERSGTPHLIYRNEARRQVIYMLLSTPEPVTIGRLEKCNVSIDWDTEVSRLHAQLEVAGDEWTIVDDGLSRNGSFVNDKRLQGRRRLDDGDTIVVGRTRIVFRSRSRSHGHTTRAAGDGGIRASITDGDRRLLVALCRPLRDPAQTLPASNQAIADELYVGIPAVKKRLGSLYERFGIEDLAQSEKRTRLAGIALQNGIVTDRDM